MLKDRNIKSVEYIEGWEMHQNGWTPTGMVHPDLQKGWNDRDELHPRDSQKATVICKVQ